MIMLCSHCGNKTSLMDCGGYEHKVSFFNNEQDKFTRKKTAWHVFERVTCSKPTLVENDYGTDDTDIDNFKNIVIYPFPVLFIGKADRPATPCRHAIK